VEMGSSGTVHTAPTHHEPAPPGGRELNVAPGFRPAGVPSAGSDAANSETEATPQNAAALKGGAAQKPVAQIMGAHHQPSTLVLPSVPVDQLLDDHAVEFEECKRWANSEAGQSARLTNPPGFANVRAHAEAHLRALSVGMNNSGSALAAPNSAKNGPRQKTPASAGQ
jgi:hypothetical protein